MDSITSNPYAAPEVTDLPTPVEARFICPNLSAFLWRGFYAALLVAPFNAAYQLFQHYVGINFLGSRAYVASASFVSIGLVALGDGLTAIMCWQLLRGRNQMLIVLVATVGLRIISVVCQSFLFFGGFSGNGSAILLNLLFSVHYGLPAMFITLLFLRMLNRRISWWVYPTAYAISSAAALILQATTRLAIAELFGLIHAPHTAWLSITSQTGWLCILAAALWFSLRLSRPSITRSA